jgi:NADH dehydrogenase
VILRPSWVFGPGDVSLNRFLGMSRFLPFVPMIGNPGKQKVQPVFIDDVANAVAECVENPAADNKAFEIGGDKVMTMSELVKTALEVLGRRRLLIATPSIVMKGVAALAQFAPGRPLTPDAIDFITQDALGDPAEIQKILGVKITTTRDALASYLAR